MPPDLLGLLLCARCHHREECQPFIDELLGMNERIGKLEVASGRRFGAREIEVNTICCLSVVRDSTEL